MIGRETRPSPSLTIDATVAFLGVWLDEGIDLIFPASYTSYFSTL